MKRRPPRSTLDRSSAASDVYKRQLEAIVAKGSLSDPDARAHLVDTLLARRWSIGRAYVEALSPLDDFRISEGSFCAVDLGVAYGLAKFGVVQVLDADERVQREYTVPGPYTHLTLPTSKPG